MTSAISPRRSNPPAKFSFLSGIHPDLDDALCETDFKSSFESLEEMDNIMRNTHNGIDTDRPHFSRQSTHSRLESLSFSSKPREITCNSLNETMESIPFSIDGMEKAKRKLKSQATRIRDLEEELERVASNSSVMTTNTNDSRIYKVLSPEERLKAHKERKKAENQHREVSGKWDSPPPLQKQSISSKVKRNDEFVDRLSADPQERKRQDEVKRRVQRAKQKYRRSSSGRQEKERDPSPLVRRMSVEEEIRTSLKKKKKSTDKSKRVSRNSREDLMKRLNMSVDERRGGKEEEHTLSAAKRASRQYRPKSAQSQNSENSDSSQEDIIIQKTTNKRDQYHREDSCQTCGSRQDCEEDTDNPGVFYCGGCWEDYENDSVESLDQDFQEDYDDEGDEEASVQNRPSQPQHSELGDAQIEQDRQDRNDGDYLWVVHDNPKLGDRLLSSGKNKMSCFLETKDPRHKNCVRIIHGTIEYSGPVPRKGEKGSRVKKGSDRGAECMRLCDVNGYVIHHDKVETRLSQNESVYEFHLDQNKAIRLTGHSAQLSPQDFFCDCVGSVDVILDPQCSSGSWYPFREASSGSRKIAPQFRSKGVGYIRLGDDMGRNGLAFLSSDNCRSFFTDVAREEEDDSNRAMLKSVSSFSSKPSYNSKPPRKDNSAPPRNKNSARSFQTSQKKKPSSRSTSTVSSHRSKVQVFESDDDDDDDDNDEDDDDSSIDSCNSDKRSKGAGEVLKELQNIEASKDMKWKDKADLLMQLGKAVSRPEEKHCCEGALNYIQDVISAKNVNIHVLRSALLVVEKVGHALEEELPNNIAWRTIMIEILKLLKNKQCGGGAREILQKLHGKAYTLSNSLTAISHVLGIGKVSSQRKLGAWKGHGTPQSNKPPMKANNVEIVEWLAVTTEAERTFKENWSPMDEKELSLLASFFMSHESHRDARCRKNALDGLLHTMLYGVDVLDMKFEQVQSLSIELKTSKPRSWTRLMKSLNMVLKMKRKKR
mmetsp:Transcript_24425/g.37338  ORF Transcript_24425/g.37338 Transcript_24425/m.37338 type:complete len:993 (-) Transcript_24425:47-3025(-)